MDDGLARESILIVIPALNECEHIDAVMDTLLHGIDGHRVNLLVADGGSDDGTIEVVSKRAEADDRVRLVHNPRARQAPGINLAVDAAGDGWDYLIRADAHAGYPPDYCATLIAEARRTGAASVTVPLHTVGRSAFARGTAAAQNTLLGTGGSAHRIGRGGQFVDHGHHALMQTEAFRSVGGYDPDFSHNEDAELDFRLRGAGHEIWLTDRTRIDYYPRDTIGGLVRQYFNYGRGRARMLAKHNQTPRLRQMLPVFVAASLITAVLGLLLAPILASPIPLVLTLPALTWVALCLVIGTSLAIRERDAALLWSGIAAMAMHAAWGFGFLEQRLHRG